MFLGDSITFGLGMPEENTFVRLVEDQARQKGGNWETINSAVKGLGMDAELAILTETGLALQPDLVVLDFYLNDFQESPGIYLTRLPGVLNQSRLAHKLTMEAWLEEMARLARQHKFQLVLVAFPVNIQVELEHLFDYPQQRLSGIARALKAPYLDLLPIFRRDYEKNKKDPLFYDQCHLTVRGHQVTGQAIYQFLKEF